MQQNSGRQIIAGRFFARPNEQHQREGIMQDQDQVEGRARGTFMSSSVGAKKRGDLVRCSYVHALELIKLGLLDEDTVVLVGASKPAGPTQRKPAGPQERKGDAPAKKSSGAPSYRDMRLSSAPGGGIRSLFSAAGRALLEATASSASRAARIATAARSRS